MEDQGMTRFVYLIAAGVVFGALPVRAQQAPPAQGTHPPATPADRKEAPAEKAVDPIREYRLGLDFQPIGLVVPKGSLRLANFPPMHPAGFAASTYSLYPAPTYGLGGGWQVTAGATGANRLGPAG